jgi:hypothetical protein
MHISVKPMAHPETGAPRQTLDTDTQLAVKESPTGTIFPQLDIEVSAMLATDEGKAGKSLISQGGLTEARMGAIGHYPRAARGQVVVVSIPFSDQDEMLKAPGDFEQVVRMIPVIVLDKDDLVEEYFRKGEQQIASQGILSRFPKRIGSDIGNDHSRKGGYLQGRNRTIVHHDPLFDPIPPEAADVFEAKLEGFGPAPCCRNQSDASHTKSL